MKPRICFALQIATLALALAAFGVVLTRGASHDTGSAFVWYLLPAVACLLGAWYVRTMNAHGYLASVGVIWGIVVLGFLSVGILFVPAGIVALVNASLITPRARRQPVVNFLSFIAGVTSVSFANMIYWRRLDFNINTGRFSGYAHIDLAPAVVFGSDVFAVVTSILIAILLVRKLGLIHRN